MSFGVHQPAYKWEGARGLEILCVRPLCGACEWVRGTCSQHAGAAVAADPRVLRGSPHSFERKRVPPLFLLSAPMVGGRDWSSGGRARDARAARARRPGDAARAAARTERAALTSFDRPPIVIKRTFVRGVSPWDVSHSASPETARFAPFVCVVSMCEQCVLAPSLSSCLVMLGCVFVRVQIGRRNRFLWLQTKGPVNDPSCVLGCRARATPSPN